MKKAEAEIIADETIHEIGEYYAYQRQKLADAERHAYAVVARWSDEKLYRRQGCEEPNVRLKYVGDAPYWNLSNWRDPDRNPGAPQKDVREEEES